MKILNILLPCLLVLLIACENSSTQNHTFKKEFINPGPGYTQVVAVTTDNVKTIYISGQIGEGIGLDAQMRSALDNLKKQLTAAGATYKDLIKMNTYIVDYQPEQLDTFRNIRKEIMGDSDMPASTLVGVQSLAKSDWLIEIEAVAVVPVHN